MEVVSFSVLSVILVNVLGIASYIYFKRCRASLSSRTPSQDLPKNEADRSDKESARPEKVEAKQKAKQKRSPPPPKKKTPMTENFSDTESFTTEEQLVQTIISQHQFSQDSINTTAVNAKPTIKKLALSQRSNSKTRKGTTNEVIEEHDPDWENVIGRKHKKKLYPTKKQGQDFGFTLDDDGGIVELPFCEMNFATETVFKPLQVSVHAENYKKFVDDTEEKVFITPALHFIKDREVKLRRQFTVKLNTLKMLGRGWNGNVYCQIEKKEADGCWTTIGRTEYVFGKPVQFVADDLTSFRAVITRGQNGSICRDLRIAAYIARPKVQNPTHHYVHLCVYDTSQQSQYKVESNMQKFLKKMEPKICSLQFGCDLQFKVQPSKKFTPDDKDVFIRWTEVCKAFVNVRFQIRLTRNEAEDPNFEPEFRTAVFFTMLKVGSTATTSQDEYFHFYWISATAYPKKGQKGKGRRIKGQDEKVSEDDGFASGSDAVTTPESENPPEVTRSTAHVSSSKPPIAPKSNVAAKKKGDLSKGPKQPQQPRNTSSNTQPMKSSTRTSPSTGSKLQPGKPNLQPPKSPSTAQSSTKKIRSKAMKKRAALLKQDKYTMNILNDLEKVNAQVQSIFSTTVLPGMGIPQTAETKKPQKSSTSEKSATKQSTAIKSQEFTKSSERPQSSGAKPTVTSAGTLSSAATTPSTTTQRTVLTGRQSPKKGKRDSQQRESKSRDVAHPRPPASARVAEKGDEAKLGTKRHVGPPAGIPASGVTQPAKNQNEQSERHKNEMRDRSQPNLSSRAEDDNHSRKQRRKSGHSQERNQSSTTRESHRQVTRSPNKPKVDPTRPKVAAQSQQTQHKGPVSQPQSGTPEKKHAPAGDAKLTNGPPSTGATNPHPKDKRIRRPRNRQRGQPIKTEAS